VTEEDLDALCSNLKMDFNTYVMETVKALTRRHMGDLSFDYQLKPQAGGVLDFLWKKQAGDGDIKVGSYHYVFWHSETCEWQPCEMRTSCEIRTPHLLFSEQIAP
jgi:hypothetical protein